MSEQLVGSMAVELALRSSSFETKMKHAAAEIKGIDDEFKVSRAEAAATGKKFDELGQRSETAAKKLALQEASCEKYRDRLKDLRDKLEEVARSQKELSVKIVDAEKAYKDSKKELKAHAKAGDLDAKSMQALATETERLAAEEKELQVSYKAGQGTLITTQNKIVKTEATYNKLRIETAQTRGEVDRLSASIDKARERLNSISDVTGRAGNAMTVGLTAPIVAAATLAGSSAIKWEDAFSDVRKTVDITSGDMEAGYERIEKQIIQLSESIPVAKEELAGIAAGAGQLGVAEQYIAKFTRVMADLDVATNLTGDAAATMFAQYANITNMDLNDVDRLGSVIVDLGNNTATTESKIGGMMQRLAGAGAVAGLTTTQIAGISATLSSLGIAEEAGGSSMSKAISQIDSAVISGGKALKAYAEVAGVSAEEFAASWKGDPVAALQLFTSGLGNISAAGGDVTKALKSVGITESIMSDTMKRLMGSGTMLTDNVNRANVAWEKNTALTDEASKKYKASASRIQITKNKVSNLATTFGESMLPVINDGIDIVGGLVDRFSDLDDETRQNLLFGAGAAALAGPALKSISSVTSGVSGLLKGIQAINAAGGVTGMLSAAAPVALALGIGAAAVAAVGLGTAWQNANSEATKLAQRMGNLNFGLDSESAKQLQTDIETAKANCDRTIEIRAEVAKDQEGIEAMLDKALENNKVTRGEENKLAKEINSWVDEGIDIAKTNMQTQIDDLNTALDRIGATPEQKAVAIQKITDKGDQSITELESYRTEALELISGLRTGEIEATEDNVARLNELLGIIGDIKAEIIAAGEGVDTFFAQAVKERAARGEATTVDTVVALNLTHEDGAKRRAKVEEASDEAISLAQTDLNAAVSTGDQELIAGCEVALDLAFTQKEGAMAANEQQIADNIQAIWDGVASKIGEQDMDSLMQRVDLLAIIQRYYNTADPIGTGYAEKIRPQIQEAMQDFIPEDIGDMPEGKFDSYFTGLIPSLEMALKNSIATDVEAGTYNPLMDFLDGALQNNEIKPEDLAGASDALKGAFALIDLTQSGGELGANLMDSLGLGITDNAQKTADASEADFLKIIEAAKSERVFDINSPSKPFQEIGKWDMLGLGKGHSENVKAAMQPLYLLATKDMPLVATQMVNGMISSINLRRQALVDSMVSAVSAAMSAAQVTANAGIKIPVSIDTSAINIRKLSRELARA